MHYSIFVWLSVLLVSYKISNAQYLRDSTRFIFPENEYALSDALIFSHYNQMETFPISLHKVFGIPEINLKSDTTKIPLFFDFGNNSDIVLTTAISEKLKYHILDTTFTYTPDGKIRGTVYSIVIPEFEVFGQQFINETAILADWQIFATEPIHGLVGLNYLKSNCFSISYARKQLAVSGNSIIETCDIPDDAVIALEKYELHPSVVYFSGNIDEIRSVIYLDTGKNYSVINKNLVDKAKIISDKSGSFYPGTVYLDFGVFSFSIYYPRVGEINRNIDTELPMGIEVGSDILKYFHITVDRTKGKNDLIMFLN